MNKKRIVLSLIAFLIVTALVLTGCNSQQQNFTYSRDIDDNGYFRGVKALSNLELCDYIGVTIPKSVHLISEQDISSGVDSLLDKYKVKSNITDRIVEDGDTLNIDYVGKINNVEFEGGSTGGKGTEVTIGVTSYIDDFLEQLIGHMPKETFDIQVTFPQDYGQEELNGKNAIFTITINHIIVGTLPKIDDSFVSENFSESNGWTSVEQMRADVEKDIQNDRISQYLQEYIEANSTVKKVPDIILDFQDNELILIYQNYADNYGMELDEFLKTNVNVENKEQLIAKYKENNAKVAAIRLIIQAIAEDANIKITKNDVQEYFKTYMNTDDYSGYEDAYGLNYLKLTILVQTVLNHIQDNAVFE